MRQQLDELIGLVGQLVSGGTSQEAPKDKALAWLETHSKVKNVRQAATEAGVSPSTMQRAIAARRKQGGRH